MTRSKSGFKGDPDWKAQARYDGVLKYPFALSTKLLKFCNIGDYLINLLLSKAVDEVPGNYILLVNLETFCDLRVGKLVKERQNCQIHDEMNVCLDYFENGWQAIACSWI